MQTNQLTRKYPNMKRMIVARGGKRGKTAGRGGKGQSARAGNKRRPEWRDIIKKLPKLRGRGVNQNKPVSDIRIIVNLASVEAAFDTNESVTPTTLIEKGVISKLSGVIPLVKILGDGEVTKALKVSGCFISESAKVKIEKAGGTVTMPASRVVPKVKKAKPVSSAASAVSAPTAAVPTKKAPATKKTSAKPRADKAPKAPKAEKTAEKK